MIGYVTIGAKDSEASGKFYDAFFGGFGAMVLGGVLLLTGVWHESVLRAGFMIAPGPLLAGLTAFPGGLLGARFGHRVVGTLGSLFFAHRLTFVVNPVLTGALALTALAMWGITGDGKAAAFEGWALVGFYVILAALTWYE